MNAWTMGSLILRDTGLAEILAIPKKKDARRAGCWAYSTMKGSQRAAYLAGMMVVMLASLRMKDDRRAGY